MNYLGGKGWELCMVEPGLKPNLIFKRPIEIQEVIPEQLREILT